ncbi:phage major capsid protein [Bradyrhizobium sp. AUGA SZCCT0177]|uniref:phage major capsid protein n=1 Tax=Bradyrhizobium sp. AUGA SZCCT0177 TaxID=2807665 RepID=UPI001BA4B47A|nr:phage major capsid protein [Bradyrhizobium sp. AUGA SZCCT0177]MBR1286064.1 phage major capsid protein [Bradyrhizobium sp. AUGA SZCCT0177]
MNDLSHELGLMRRELRDARAIVSRLDASMAVARRAVPRRSPQQRLAQTLACYAIGRQKTQAPARIAATLYNNDPALLATLASPGMIGRSAVAPAMTTVSGWAAELASAGNADFLQVLAPKSIYAQLSAFPGAIRVSLAGRGSIKVPSRAPSSPLSAPFVGEGQPIAVRQLALSTAALVPHKAAVISQFSEELMKHSTPSIEAVIETTMAYDASVSIDGVLLGSTAPSAVSPGGILAGVTPTAATAGGTLAALAGDVRALAAAIETTGPLIAPIVLMSMTSALLLGSQLFGFIPNGGAYDMPIIASPTVPAKQLIMLDTANFASAEGDTPDISSTKEVSLHAEDTAPLPLVTGAQGAGVPAAPQFSAFQTATIAVRLLQDCTWVMTRAGRVAVINNVTW